jgi:hypothetical protein
MPFTPFHLGPGAAFKAIGGTRFSFMIFGGSQILMDIDPLVGIIEGKPVLHGPSHTVLGALVIGFISGVIGRPATQFALCWLRIRHARLTWTVSFVSAFVGTFSHVGLDAIMHRDMAPLWPFASGNALLGFVSVGWLYLLCVVAGALGMLIIAGRNVRSR